jgi:hypothetical protein
MLKKLAHNSCQQALAATARNSSMAEGGGDQPSRELASPYRPLSPADLARITSVICGERFAAGCGPRATSQAPRPQRLAPRALRPRWIMSLGLLCWFWPEPAAQAQQALQTALALDPLIQNQAYARTNPIVALPADQPSIGPVGVTIAPYTSIGLDDNINLTSTNAQSDVIVGTGMNLGAGWQATAKSILQFNSQLGYNFYLSHPGHDYVQVNPGSALTWGLYLGDWEVVFFDQFNYSQNVVSVASISNVSNIPTLDNNVGARALWRSRHWLVDFGYSYDDYLSTSKQFNYLDNASNELFARGGWRFSNEGQLGLETSATFTTFSHPPEPNNNSYSIGPYLIWPLDRYINISLHAGPTWYEFAESPTGQAAFNLNAYYVNFDVSHQMSRYTSEELSVSRNVSAGYDVGAAYTEQLNIAYILQWHPKPWINFHLSLTYQDGQQPSGLFFPEISGSTVTFVEEMEHFNRYGINPGVNYQLTKRISAYLSYTHWTRGSNISQNRYSDDAAYFQLQYSF